MKTSLKIYPELRKKSKKDGLIPFYLRVIKNGIKSEGRIYLIDAVSEKTLKNWHQPTSQFSKGEDVCNDNISTVKKAFNEIIRNKSKYKGFSAKMIKELLMDDAPKVNSTMIRVVENYFQNHIENQNHFAKGTIRNKQKAINHLKNYLKVSKLQSIYIEDFDKPNLQKFIAYLLNGDEKSSFKGMKRVSASGIHKELKTIFNGLIDFGVILQSPFNGTKVKFKKKIQPILTESEFKKILHLDVSNSPKLTIYKDIFLFLCYTGLSYIDLLNLKPRDVEGYKLNITRTKSNICIRQHIVDGACTIIDTYRDSFECNLIDTVLPKKSLDKMNLNLKIIAAKAGVSVELSTKYARRFFRQSLNTAYVKENLLVKSMMGHSFASEIDGHYLHVTEKMLEEAKVKLNLYINQLNN